MNFNDFLKYMEENLSSYPIMTSLIICGKKLACRLLCRRIFYKLVNLLAKTVDMFYPTR